MAKSRVQKAQDVNRFSWLTEESIQKAKDLGWLDKDGICKFPRDVVAVPLGIISPGIPNLDKLNEDELKKAVDKGWIKFVDGNADRHTFEEYVNLFPEYPDPIFCLTVRGNWPPMAVQIGKEGKRILKRTKSGAETAQDTGWLTDESTQKAKDLGWLGEDGICKFPRDVVAVPLGIISPGILNLDKLNSSMAMRIDIHLRNMLNCFQNIRIQSFVSCR
jgi:hypothetical protein